MKKFIQNLDKVENWVFSYFVSRNQHLVYILKLCIIFFFGTIIPGYVFMVVEGQAEQKFEPYDIQQDRKELMERLRRYKADSASKEQFVSNMTVKKALDKYVELILKNEESKKFVRNNRGRKIWTLWNSIVFAGTVYTTLGYGELTPNTYTGRLLTIIYGLVGIPLFLVALSDFGRFITLIIKFLWSYVRRLYYTGSCAKKKKIIREDPIIQQIHDFTIGLEATYSSMDLDKSGAFSGQPDYSEETPTTPDLSTFNLEDEFDLPISLSIFMFVVYIFIAALVYSHWERWSVFESWYFMFISLSTIGFGDFIPHHPFCQILSIFLIFFGLALCTILIRGIQQYFDASFQEGELVFADETDSFYGSESGSFSNESLDALDLKKDESVQRIIKMEEMEDYRRGIYRTRSRAIRLNKSIIEDNYANYNDEKLIVEDKRDLTVVDPLPVKKVEVGVDRELSGEAEFRDEIEKSPEMIKQVDEMPFGYKVTKIDLEK